ncbi:MAG TPA: alpha/beta fold hydrolase [Rhodanobacteraceae bacterium]|nr:alpha/beta fold hydrolase [Rhodanobacteraceae bacterium]
MSGNLHTLECGDPDSSRVVVMLHGRNMQAADLAPFGASLGVDARFIFPDAPLAAEPGRTWWPVASEARLREQGARDLHAMDPPGRVEARAMLDVLCNEVGTDKRLVLVGFSQGGMLAMDYVLHGGRVDALALLSSTRIAFDEWQPLLPRLAGLPVLVAHGREDQELSFAAGEALRDAAIAGGAEVTWLPFDGGHGIPLPVWRGLRRFLQGPA